MQIARFLPNVVVTIAALSVSCALHAQALARQQAITSPLDDAAKGNSLPGATTPAAASEEKETVERLGPFSLAGNNYTVVLHKKHLAATEDTGPNGADGVVAMEIADTTGAILYRRTYPLWADPEVVSAWQVFAHILTGTNGTGLLLKSGPDIDASSEDPESSASFAQIFGVVNGKLVPFSGPFAAMVGKPDATGTYRTVAGMGPQSDVIRLALGTGRFVMDIPVRVDWAQGKLALAPKCPETAADAAHPMCEFGLLDPDSFLQRRNSVTFVRLYPTPDENSGRPERAAVKPVSKVEILACRAALEMKQPDPLRPPSPADFPVKDMVQIGPAPGTDTWLQVRIDGKTGWIHSDKDFIALGLPEVED